MSQGEDKVLVVGFDTVTSSHGTKWEDGKAYVQANGGPWERRPDLDFGTPMGDLLIDPWMQDALKEGKRPATEGEDA